MYGFPLFLIPLTITYFCTQLAWRTAAALARLHEHSRYDLLASTPVGNWQFALFIGHTYASRATGAAFKLLVIGLVTSSVIMLVISRSGGQVSYFFQVFSIEIALVIAVYLDFRQALSTSFLVGVAASLSKQGTTARFWAVAGCVGLQLAAYALWFAGFIATTNSIFRWADDRWLRDSVLTVSICIATPILLLVREVVIYVLWRWLRWHINDDVPTLKQV